VRRLVVTGDDFGYSREVNRAIAEAYDRGILTNASLMVSGDAAAEAVALARSRPGLSVGLHLVVADGRAALPASQIPRLVDGAGRFRAGLVRQGLRYQFSRGARSELAHEVGAQLERFVESGLALSHVDGHHHMHLHPTVLKILLGLADRFRIPAIRLPHEELSLALSLDRCAVPSKVLSSLIFRLLRASGEGRLRAAGIPVPERVYGLLATGRITEDYLLGLIPRIRSNDVELYCHPATAVPGQRFHGPPASGPEEFAALLSQRVKDALRQSRFVLARPAAARMRLVK
jgi:hopanoid biosynthesis associated protein HpnK